MQVGLLRVSVPAAGIAFGKSGLQGNHTMRKRIIDVLVASVAILLTLPLMGIIALLLSIFQGRPVLFSQVRSTKGGRTFKLYKFRSMTTARDDAGALLPDEARTTRIGWWLRRTRIDELPQFFHVLVGDMSLVGPRPLPEEKVEAFGELGKRRGEVRPGLTGWAQVNGNALLEPEDKIALDIFYVDRRSLPFDLRIMMMTVGVIAYGDQVNPVRIDEALNQNSPKPIKAA